MKTEHTLDDADAAVGIAAVKAALAKTGKPGTIVVVDNHGETIAAVRQYGAAFTTLTIASNKAYTAARLKRPSGDFGRAARHPDTGYDLAYFSDPRIIGFGGGLPVIKDGHVLGAVGVSGLTQAEDDELAKTGVAAILAQL